MSFKEISIKKLGLNPFEMIGDRWMLITSGDESGFNTMTASWGGLGVLWNKNVSFSFVRPQRYTFEFMEKYDYYTLSFYPDEYKSALALCGSKSGRNVDKVEQTGLTPNFSEKSVYFDEASLVLVCRKLHSQFLDPGCFVDEEIEENYPENDYHKLYVGEIVKALEKI